MPGERRTSMVKQFPTIFTAHLDIEGEVTEQLDDLRHMVVILREQLSLSMGIK